jgi:hypothetical protein
MVSSGVCIWKHSLPNLEMSTTCLAPRSQRFPQVMAARNISMLLVEVLSLLTAATFMSQRLAPLGSNRSSLKVPAWKGNGNIWLVPLAWSFMKWSIGYSFTKTTSLFAPPMVSHHVCISSLNPCLFIQPFIPAITSSSLNCKGYCALSGQSLFSHGPAVTTMLTVSKTTPSCLDTGTVFVLYYCNLLFTCSLFSAKACKS